jgi:hypothetical protein
MLSLATVAGAMLIAGALSAPAGAAPISGAAAPENAASESGLATPAAYYYGGSHRRCWTHWHKRRICTWRYGYPRCYYTRYPHRHCGRY